MLPVPSPMIIDGHVHAAADTPGHGSISARVSGSIYFRFVRWRLGITAASGAELERQAEAKLLATVAGAAEIDAAVVLALDAAYKPDGRPDPSNTHFHVTNDYAADLCRRHPKLLFGCSVNPYRTDAVAELERCVGQGAVLCKWLPLVQNFDPADTRCFPFYEALAHHRLPLLSHTGGERSLPYLSPISADPSRLRPALERGVTVIAAHCGTRAFPSEPDYLPTFARMAREYEHLYGDTAALNLPTRSYGYETLLADDALRRKLVHGSDWPIMPFPPRRIGWGKAARLFFRESNWIRRDILAKRALGFDESYWQRAAQLLRLRAEARS